MGVVTDRPIPAVRAAYGRMAGRPAWAVCGLFVVGSLVSTVLDPSVPRWTRYLPLLASVLVFGLPHGAIDYLVPARVADVPVVRSGLVVGLLYAAVGGAYAVVWFRLPVAAAAFFIALTWFHWGQGDVHTLVTFHEVDHLDSRPLRVATGFVRGGLPMLVPLVGFPERYRAVVETWVGLFVREPSLAAAFTPEVRALAGGVFLLASGVTLVAGYRRDGASPGVRVDAGETALLWLFFLTVPPLVAIGVYFCVWHSLRHVLRFVAVDGDATPLSARGVLTRFGREAAPLTALALVFLAAFGLLVSGATASPSAPGDAAGLYLVFIAVLTLPHVVVVTWMDRREGVWRG